MGRKTSVLLLSALVLSLTAENLFSSCLFGNLFSHKDVSERGEGFAVINIIDTQNDEPVDGMVEFKDGAFPPMFVEDGNRKILLPAGEYCIRVMSDECKLVEKKIAVIKDSVIVFFFEMEPIERMGSVLGRVTDISTGKFVLPEIEILEDEECKITIDDVRGTYGIELMPGEYTLTADKSGYCLYRKSLVVKSGEAVESDIILIQKNCRILMKDLSFDKKSGELTKESYAFLDLTADALKSSPDIKIEIQGFTDDKGKAADNMKLSLDRAKKVKEYLIGKGIEEQRIQAKGFGETMNISDNESESNRAKNRRIELVIIE